MTERATAGLQHVVLMRFPTPPTADEDAEVRSLVAALSPAIDTLRACRFDNDLTGERTQGYHYLLFTEFDDADGLAAYVVHPVHQRLVAFLNSHDCQRLAFDYRF